LDGFRTLAQQGGIPSANTKAKAGESYHNYGLAFDLSVVNPDGSIDYDPTTYYQFGPIGQSYGLSWGANSKHGGSFQTFNDPRHFELPLMSTSKLRGLSPSQLAALPCP
jgi:peptidoglycan LD-endopeptidase CwlK